MEENKEVKTEETKKEVTNEMLMEEIGLIKEGLSVLLNNRLYEDVSKIERMKIEDPENGKELMRLSLESQVLISVRVKLSGFDSWKKMREENERDEVTKEISSILKMFLM